MVCSCGMRPWLALCCCHSIADRALCVLVAVAEPQDKSIVPLEQLPWNKNAPKL
jgi:hypothetical protein